MQSVIMENICHSYGKKSVLNGINMHIDQGSIYGLLGPSGCGKTTVVKIMAGILTATSGKVVVLGEEMPKLSMLSRIGYMAQSDALYLSLSAMENMQFFGALYGMKTKDISSRAFSTASLVGLENDLSRPVQSFSGGMKRRLSLAIALLHQPQVLILDEPTVGIDPLLRQKIWQQLRAIADSGVSIVLTTHVMDEAEKCDYLAMLRDGQIIAEDTPSALKRNTNSATIEEAFIYYGEVDHAH